MGGEGGGACFCEKNRQGFYIKQIEMWSKMGVMRIK